MSTIGKFALLESNLVCSVCNSYVFKIVGETRASYSVVRADDSEQKERKVRKTKVLLITESLDVAQKYIKQDKLNTSEYFALIERKKLLEKEIKGYEGK